MTDLRIALARLICPARYALVPRTPTRAMVEAARRAPLPSSARTAEKHRHRYRAMIDAAQED